MHILDQYQNKILKLGRHVLYSYKLVESRPMPHQSFATSLSLGLCVLLSLGCLTSAHAAPPPAGAAALTDERVTERLDFLDRRFQAQQSDAELWEYGWLAFNGGSTILSSVQAATADNRKDRDMSIVQSVEGLVGVADLVFRPLPSLEADSVCSQKVTTREERLQCLAAKESLAERAAERANEPYHIAPHVETLGVNLLAGGVVWVLSGFSRALITAVPGELIGEIQLWTTPEQPSHDYAAYQVHFSPMMSLSSRDNSQLIGVEARWRF